MAYVYLNLLVNVFWWFRFGSLTIQNFGMEDLLWNCGYKGRGKWLSAVVTNTYLIAM